jgi:lipopolysaccharide/colanic/teichoic acid biosynthesis glycosyltransferase
MDLITQKLSRQLSPKLFITHASATPSPVVLPEPVFGTALRRERRRTERSGRRFVLMLTTPSASSGKQNSPISLEEFASALSYCSRETDLIGWHQQQNGVLGAIFTELGNAESGVVVDSLRQKVRSVVDKVALGKEESIRLSFHFFPPDHAPEETPIPVLHGEPYQEPQSDSAGRRIKRALDAFSSVLALISLSPLLFAISVLIKLTSSGPVLFRQTRIGQFGKEFTFFKFRSMYTGSDPALHREYVSHFIAGKAPMHKSAGAKTSVYKIINDPRVTPFGRFLRRTSLDELPQLLNVLRGEMSLVGPRPPLPYELNCYDLWHLRRMVDVKPGITGLWQVCGRSKTSFDEMVRLDLQYAKAWSLALDFMILLKTPGAVISGAGAY